MIEPSTHLIRDKKDDDPLERILEPWGLWRQWGVDGLSSKRKSPLEGYNQLRRAFTDECDKIRKEIIRTSLMPIVEEKYLAGETNRQFKEWKIRIESLPAPKETRNCRPKSPKYGGHKYYSKIDRVLSEIYEPYYYILIRKYEDLWEYKDFAKHYRINENLASQKIFKARRAARKILKKNGYKA